ncbi:hypothetical protein Tco_1533935 [Tanacetum coccineum]
MPPVGQRKAFVYNHVHFHFSIEELLIVAFISKTTVVNVKNRPSILRVTPAPVRGSFEYCERVAVEGVSRMKLGSFSKKYHVLLLPSRLEWNDEEAQVCVHRDASLGLCECEKDDWRSLENEEWRFVMSPYEQMYVDVKLSPRTHGYVSVYLEEALPRKPTLEQVHYVRAGYILCFTVEDEGGLHSGSLSGVSLSGINSGGFGEVAGSRVLQLLTSEWRTWYRSEPDVSLSWGRSVGWDVAFYLRDGRCLAGEIAMYFPRQAKHMALVQPLSQEWRYVLLAIGFSLLFLAPVASKCLASYCSSFTRILFVRVIAITCIFQGSFDTLYAMISVVTCLALYSKIMSIHNIQQTAWKSKEEIQEIGVGASVRGQETTEARDADTTTVKVPKFLRVDGLA